MTHVRTRWLTVFAKEAVRLTDEIVLLPGRYRATSRQMGRRGEHGVEWTAPSYSVDVPANDRVPPGFLTEERVALDVTSLVAEGHVRVAAGE